MWPHGAMRAAQHVASSYTAHVQLLSVHFRWVRREIEMMALFSVLLLVASVQVAICKPYDLAVTDVGSNSAVIHWKTTELSTTIENFRILCNGTRHYVSMDGEHLLDTHEKLQYAPSGKDHVLIGGLQENFNYSCTIQEGVSPQTPILYGEVSDPCYFSTNYGDPEQPKAPEIQVVQRKRSIKVILFSTSTRFGPIRLMLTHASDQLNGYHVQFHLVESKTPDGLPLIDDDAYDPHLPSSSLVSKSEAQLSVEAKSFWLDFENGMLPNNIEIGQKLLNGALKGGREYAVVTVPYTAYMKQNASVLLFTPSNLSAIFRTWNFSLTTAQLDTSDPAELALVIALGVGLPLLVLGYLACFGIVIYCIVRRRRRKRMKKEYSKRDIIQALALRRAQQEGIELPWYNHQTTGNDQGDLPWLDPFSAQPRMAQSVSSSQSAQGQPEISSTAAQPSDSVSLVISNDVVLMEAMPVFSKTNLTRQDVSSAAVQQSQPISLVISNDAQLTEAMSVELSLTAPELGISSTAVQPSDHDSTPMLSDAEAITGVSTLRTTDIAKEDVSSTATQLCDDDESLVMSNDVELTEKVPELSHNTAELANAEAPKETSVDRDAQCNGSEINQQNNQSDGETLSPHQFAEEATEVMDNKDDDDLAMHAVLSNDASHNSFRSSTSSSSDDHLSSDSQGSTHSIGSDHLSLHQEGSTEQCMHGSSMCDSPDLGENKLALLAKATLEVEESFYSSKMSNSEEESSSDFHQFVEDNTPQPADSEHSSPRYAASADQCTKSNEHNDHTTDNSEADKQVLGDASQERDNSASINSCNHGSTDLIIVHAPLPGSSLEDVNSSRTSKVIDDKSSSDFYPSSTQSIDCEHLSLHQVASTAQSMHTANKSSGCDCYLSEDKPALPEEASLEVDEPSYSSKTSNSEEDSSSDSCQDNIQSTSCEQLSFHHVASTAQLISDESCTIDGHNSACDVDEIIAASLEFKQMVYESRSSTCCIRHIYSEYNLAEHKPPLTDSSLEVNASSHSFKTSNNDSYSSLCFHQDNFHPADCEQPNPHESTVADQCAHKSSNDDNHSTHGLGAEELQSGDASLEERCSWSNSHNDRSNSALDVHSSLPRVASLDPSTSPDMNGNFQSSNTINSNNSISRQTSTPCVGSEHLSLHQVVSTTAQCMHSSSKSTDGDERNTCDLGEKNSQQGEELEGDCSFHTSSSDGCHSSHFQQDMSDCSHHGELHISSAVSDHDVHSMDDLSVEKPLSRDALIELRSVSSKDCSNCNLKPLSGDASVEVDCLLYSSGSNHSDSDNGSSYNQDITVSEPLYPQGVPLTSKSNSSNSNSSNSNSSNIDHYSTCDVSAEKPLPGGAFGDSEVNNSSTTDDCSSSSFCQEGTQSTDCEHLSLHQVATTTPCVHSTSTSSNSNDQGACNIIEEKIQPSAAALELTMNPPVCSLALISHANHSNYGQDVVKSLPGDASPEGNGSFNDKTSNSDDGISPDFLQDNLQTADDEQQSPYLVELADQCLQSSSKTSNGDDYSTHDLGVEKPPLGDALESSKLNDSDDCNKYDLISLPGDASNSLEVNGSSHCSKASNREISSVQGNAQSLFAEYQQQRPYYVVPTVHSSSDDDSDSFYLSDKNSLPGCGELGSDTDNRNFHQDSASTVGNEHRVLYQVEATVQRLPRSSDHHLSPVGSVVSSEDEIRIVMELDEEELPHLFDKEPPDTITAVATENSHHTVGSLVDASTDYSTALSECSSGGLREMSSESNHSAVSSGLEYGDCVQDCDMSETKASNSCSTSVTKKSSDEPQDSNYSLSRHSTLTPCNICGQLSESNVRESEEERTQSSDCEDMSPFHETSAAQRVHSDHQLLSPVGSVVSTDHDVCITMELEFPHHFDKELTAVATENSHHTADSLVDNLTDYSTAFSECSSGGLREMGSESDHNVTNIGLEHRDCVQDFVLLDTKEVDDTSTKANSSASLSKGSLDGSHLHNSDGSMNASLRCHSTITPSTILGRFCVSNVSEGELYKDFTQSTLCEGISSHHEVSADQSVCSATGHQLSPVGSIVSTDDEVRIAMELDEEESPIIASEISGTSMEYYTALSQFSNGQLSSGSNHSAAARHSEPVVVSSGSESMDYVQVNMEPLGSKANLLKMSSSASLFIPRGFSNGPLPDNDSSSSLASFQRNDSTTTFHSILCQLSGSSASEGDQEQRYGDPLPNQTPPIYEPY